MKIRNDFIIIENGKQQIKIHNMILDTYLKSIIDCQFDIDKMGILNMNCVFLKFDTELDFNQQSNLNKSDFDWGLEISSFEYPKMETSQKEIINNYIYTFSKGKVVVDTKKEGVIEQFEEYDGRKITAIGFSNYIDGTIYACVDTRNYNIYYDSTQVFSIIRRDIFSTDGFIYSNNKAVKEPIHLCAYKRVIEDGITNYYSAVLKTIGLGNNTFKMAEEHTLLPYKEHVEINESSILIKDELNIERKSEGLFPSNELYPQIDLYPARIIVDNFYPSLDVYPGIDVYPVYSAYQYVQLKYEIYKSRNYREYEDTGTYYLLNMLVGKKEKIKLNILYERA